jgi:hypothetical protein
LLQSTVDGAVAAVNGKFGAALMEGLRGRGRAKVWVPQATDKMYVRYDSLRTQLKSLLATSQRITSRVDGSDGESDGILAILQPVPKSRCIITIEGVPAAIHGELVLRRGRSGADERQSLSNQPAVIELEPDDYIVSLRLNNVAAETRMSMPADLYDDRTVVFTLPAAATVRGGLESLAIAPESAVSNVDIVVPANTTLDIRNINSGLEKSFAASARQRLPPGQYFTTLRSHTGQVLKRQDIRLAGGERIINLTEWQQSAPHSAIANQLPPEAVVGGTVDFSESLGGPITDPDLDLWLALVGGARIIGPWGDYSKLAQFPLHSFAEEGPDASPIYVLAGLENPAAVLELAISHDGNVTWSPAIQPKAMPGIHEAYFPQQAGSWLLSFRIDGGAPYTIASLASPNRAMLITISLESDDSPRVSQYLLPLGHLVHRLPAEVQTVLTARNHLRDVKFLAQASRAFRKRQDLAKELAPSQLDDLLYAKWLDPIACSLAGYECIRRGRQDLLPQAVLNMRTYFSDLPDTAALARLMGDPVPRPLAPPLFLEGVLAFPEYRAWLPLPAGHLDYASPWTAWRAAVKS